MTTVLSNGDLSSTPIQVLGYTSTRQTGNTLHPILDRVDHDVSLKAAGLRSGTLTFGYSEYLAAIICESLHAAIGVVTLTDDTVPGISMTYVTSGAITVQLEDETRALWTVAIDFQEIA